MTDDRGSLAVRLAPFAVAALVVVLVAAGATGALPVGDQQPDGEELLERVTDRYENAETVVGDATVTVANDTTERSYSLSFVTADSNASRVETTHQGNEYVLGTNGTVAWVHDVANDTVFVRELPENGSAALAHGNGTGVLPGTPDDGGLQAGDDPGLAAATASKPANLSQYLAENVTVTVRGTATVGDSEAYVVGLDPTNESIHYNATVWVDVDDYRVHRLRVADGTNRTTVAFEDLRFDASVHESTFRPPGDASVTVVSRDRYDNFDDAQAATDVTLQRLDGEYAFESALVVTRSGTTVALQAYAGPAANVTLAATADDLPYPVENGTSVTVNGENATYVDLGDRGAVVWTDDGVTRAVVADLPQSDLVALAERVRVRD